MPLTTSLAALGVPNMLPPDASTLVAAVPSSSSSSSECGGGPSAPCPGAPSNLTHVLVIGQQKAASTAAYYTLLSVLDERNMSSIEHAKELNFFSYPQPCALADDADCSSLLGEYQGPPGYVLDGTPCLLYTSPSPRDS